MSQLQFQDQVHDERITSFADVVLPVPIPKLFTYRIPKELKEQIAIGHRVVVQFGKKKILTGIVAALHQQAPKEYEARYIITLLDDVPMVKEHQLALFEWLADYYLCTIGEVLNAALPSGLKLSSESHIQLHPNYKKKLEDYSVNEKEALLIEVLEEKKALSYSEASNIIHTKNIYHFLKALLSEQIVLVYEEVKEKYQPKKIKKIRLVKAYEDKSALEALFEDLSKKPKQEDVLLRYLQEVPIFKSAELNEKGLSTSLLLQGDISPSSLQTLVKNGVFETFEEIVNRFEPLSTAAEAEIVLNDAQKAAKAQIMTLFQQKETVLLHGVTGSGKTEIYVEMIREALEGGGQVLYLLPEIALTTQIVSRLQAFFGSKMGVYHSKFSDNERVEVWRGVINGDISFVVGVRSAIFLPFDNLGLIIVDEEHETSYKQYNPAPRYHARNAALVLARMHFAKTLLGSATPSLESYFNATQGKYGLVTLKERYGNAALPEIRLANIKEGRKRKTLKADFTEELITALATTLEKGEQAIVFQNRRGYAPYLTCEACSWIPKCQNCAVSLTYHMYHNELRCHYCGYKEKPPTSCRACGSHHVKTIGFGTEKLEDDLKLLLPEAKIQRMDLDTTRRKYSYQTIIDNFEKGEIDILVGTQMVSKGLDFDKVSLVGIVDADRMLYYPDFRSFERAFQMIVQVSGRAGRRENPGLVIIQTANVDQPFFTNILRNDYLKMYEQELQERRQFLYPPFVRLVKVTLKHEDKGINEKAAVFLKRLLTEELGANHILGPQEPVISKIRNQYLMEILVKIGRKSSTQKIKEKLRNTCQSVEREKDFKKLRITLDVDPL